MPFDDFKKLFGLILLTNINYRELQQVKHTSYNVEMPQMHKQAQHFKVSVKEAGLFSFSIIQGLGNMVQSALRPKGPIPPQVSAKPGQVQSTVSLNGNKMRISQTSIQASKLPMDSVGGSMQLQPDSSILNDP